eukprot:TRINITY_DN19632_c0_g1_i1.p1 TRINITY_DN19632_c0_g1~~TRINITY_DN19632_c0_g1_i1.p1  ORF type:complete len:1591 (+),score=502.36 TRINITY_DN19632_c0_g1_i1:85-4773(+)
MPASQSSWQAPPIKQGASTAVQCSILQSIEAKSSLGGLTAAVADEEGNMWVAGTQQRNQNITIRKPQSCEVLDTVEGFEKEAKITHMALCEGHVWALSAEGQALIYKASTRKQIASSIISAEPVTGITVHTSTVYIITSSSLKLYEGTTGRSLRWWPIASVATSIAVLSPTSIVTGHSSGQLKYWDETGTVTKETSAHSSDVTSILKVAIPTRAPSAVVITSGADSIIRIWDDSSTSPAAELRGHSAPVKSLITLSNSLLASCSLDGRIVLWDLQALKSIGALDQHGQPLVALSPAQSMLNTVMWSFGKDNSLTVWGLRHTVPDFSKFEELAAELVKKDRMLRAAHEELEKSERTESKRSVTPAAAPSPPPPQSSPPIANDIVTAVSNLANINPYSSSTTSASPFTKLAKGVLSGRDVPKEWSVSPQNITALQLAMLDKWEALKLVEDIHIDYKAHGGPLESVVTTLRMDLDKANEKVARLTTSTVSHLNSRIENLMAQVQTKEHELRDMALSLSKSRSTEEAMQGIVQQKTSQIEKMASVQAQLTADLESRDLEIQSLQQKLREVSDMSQTDEEIARLQSAKSFAEEEANKYQQENAELVVLLDKYRQPSGMIQVQQVQQQPKQSVPVGVVETPHETLTRLQQAGLIQDFKKLLNFEIPPPTYLPPPDMTIEQMIRKCEARGDLQHLYGEVVNRCGPLPPSEEIAALEAELQEHQRLLSDTQAKLRNSEVILRENEDHAHAQQNELRVSQNELRETTMSLKDKENQVCVMKQKLESTLSELGMQKDRRHELEEALQAEKASQQDMVAKYHEKDGACRMLNGELHSLKETLAINSSSSTEKEGALYAAREKVAHLENTVTMFEKELSSQSGDQVHASRAVTGLLSVVRDLKQLAGVEAASSTSEEFEADNLEKEKPKVSETVMEVASQLRLVAASFQSRDDVNSETKKDALALHGIVETELKRAAPDAVLPPVSPRSLEHRLIGTTTANMRLLLQAWHRTEQDVARQTELMADELAAAKQQLSQIAEAESDLASQPQSNMIRQPTPSQSGRSLQTPSMVGRGGDDMALLRQALESKSKDYNALQQEIIANRQRMEEKHKRIQALQELTDDRSRIIQEERHKSYQLQREIQYLKREGKRRSERELEERLAEAEDALSRGSSKAEDMVAALQKKLADVETTLTEAQNSVPDLEKKLATAEQRLVESQEQVQLQQELLASQSETYDEDQSAKVQDLEGVVQRLEDEVAFLKKALQDSQHARQEEERKVVDLVEKGERLQKEGDDLRAKLEYGEELLAKRDVVSRRGSDGTVSSSTRMSSSGDAGSTHSVPKENRAWLSPPVAEKTVPLAAVSLSPPDPRPDLAVLQAKNMAKPPLVMKQPAMPPQSKLSINKPTQRTGQHAPPPQYAFPPQTSPATVRSDSGRALSPVEQRRVQAGLMVSGAAPHSATQQSGYAAQRRGSGKSTCSDKSVSSRGKSQRSLGPVVVSATIPSPEREREVSRGHYRKRTPSSPSSSLSSSVLMLSGGTPSPKRMGRDLTNTHYNMQQQPRKLQYETNQAPHHKALHR